MPDVIGYANLTTSPYKTGSLLTPVGSSPTSPSGSQATDVARYVYDLYDVAKQHRKVIDSKWDDYYNFYRGKQTRLPTYLRPKDNWRSVIVINHIMINIENIAAVLMNNRPKINVSPNSPQQRPYVQNLQVALDAVWRRRKCLRYLEDGVKSALIYGTGYLKVYWDSTLDEGYGNINVGHVLSPNLFVDPEALDVDKNSARFVIEKKPVTFAHIEEFWPDKAPWVQPDADGSQQQQKSRSMLTNGFDPVGTLGWLGPSGDNIRVGDQTEFSVPPYRTVDTKGRWVTLLECWVRDPATETRTERWTTYSPQGPQFFSRTYEVSKYPNGRLIHVAGGVVLDDAPVDTPHWPFVRIVDISVPGEFFGIGEVEILKDLQIAHNRSQMQMMDYASMLGNGIWIIDNNAMVRKDEVSNRPNAVVFVTPGSRVERVAPPPMPSWMPMMGDRHAHNMQLVAGVSGTAQGVPPKGARSGAAFAAAEDISNTRINSRGRNVEATVEDAGHIMVGLLQRYWTVPRWVRLIGDADQVYFTPFDGRNLRGDWDITVAPGSMAQITKAAEQQQYIQLFQLRLVDQRAVLEKLEVSDREAIMRRMGNMMDTPQPNRYPGYPGEPSRDNPGPSGLSGYSTAIRTSTPPPQPPGPPGMPGGNGGPSGPQGVRGGPAQGVPPPPQGFGR